MPWTINYIFVLIGTFLIAIVGTPLVRSFLGFCTSDLGIYAYDYSEGCLAYFLF